MIRYAKGSGLLAPETGPEVFCSNLSFGLHAVAQPLTIIRACLFKEYTDRMTREELQDLAVSLSLEVERVCSIFSSLQQLVYIESNRPALSAMPIIPLIVDSVEGMDILYKESGLELVTVLPDSCEVVLANRQRSLEALSSVLFVVHTHSHAGDTVKVEANSISSTMVRVVIENVGCQLKAINALASLSLAVAGSHMRSQGEAFSWSLQPLRVEMEFKKASSTSQDGL